MCRDPETLGVVIIGTIVIAVFLSIFLLLLLHWSHRRRDQKVEARRRAWEKAKRQRYKRSGPPTDG